MAEVRAGLGDRVAGLVGSAIFLEVTGFNMRTYYGALTFQNTLLVLDPKQPPHMVLATRPHPKPSINPGLEASTKAWGSSAAASPPSGL